MLPSAIRPCNGGWTVTETGFCVDSPEGGTLAYYPSMPDTCLIRMKISLSSSNGQIRILLGTHIGTKNSPETENGYQILLDPSEGMVRLRKHYIWDQRNDIAVIPFTFPKDRAISLEILRHNGILEVGVDGTQTLVSRLMGDASGGFAISVQDLSSEISDFVVFVPEN